MKALKTPLTPEEKKRLAELEAIIIPGIVDCLKIGNALREISDSRLYRESHTTFKEYVKDTYSIGVRTAYELVEHSEIVEQVKNECATFAQTATPRQTRELKKVPKEKRAKVIELASADGPPTTKKLQEAAAPVIRESRTPEPVIKESLTTEPPVANSATTDPEEDEGQALQGFEIDVQACLGSIPEGANLSPYIAILRKAASGLEKRALRSNTNTAGWFKAYTS